MKKNKWQAIEAARKTLLLTDDATLAEIKNAYHQLCKKYHPDGNNRMHGESAQKIYKLTEAYEVLMKYCREYRFPLSRPSTEEPDMYNPEEWWVERFGEHSFWKKNS
jgi:hypothetical protein